MKDKNEFKKWLKQVKNLLAIIEQQIGDTYECIYILQQMNNEKENSDSKETISTILVNKEKASKTNTIVERNPNNDNKSDEPKIKTTGRR